MGILRLNLSVSLIFLSAILVFQVGCGESDTSQLAADDTGTDYRYQDHLKLTSVKKNAWTGNSMGSDYYTDIMSYAAVDKFPQARHLASGNLAINAHETNHMSTSIQKAMMASRFHYIGNGQGAMLRDIERTKVEVLPYISEYFRKITSITDSADSPISEPSNLYNMYLASTTRHKDIGHIFEEWNCYIIDATVSAEIAENAWEKGYEGEIIPRSEYEGNMLSRSIKFFNSPEGEFVRLGTPADKNILTRGADNISPNMAFHYFGAVASHMIREQFPAYFDRVPDPQKEQDYYQFKAVFAMLAERSMAAYNKGMDYPILAGSRLAKVMHDYMVTSPETESLRQHLIDSYGEAWTKRVYGFPKD